LKELQSKAKSYATEKGKAGADRIRKFLAQHNCTKLSGLDAEQRTELASKLGG